MTNDEMLRSVMAAADPARTAPDAPSTEALLARVSQRVESTSPPAVRIRSAKVRGRWRPVIATAVASACVVTGAVLISSIGTAPPASAQIVLAPFDDTSVQAFVLPEPPAGLEGPDFSGSQSGSLTTYSAGSPSRDSIGISSTTQVRPELRDAVARGSGDRLAIAGTNGWVYRAAADTAEPAVYVTWQASDHRWVELGGTGRYAAVDTLAHLASGIRRVPGSVLPVRLSVAPKGWSIEEFRTSAAGTDAITSGRDVVRLHPASGQRGDSDDTVTVTLSDGTEPFPAGRPIGTVEAVTSANKSGQLLHQQDGAWALRLSLSDGRDIVVLAPSSFDRDQVLTLANGVGL